MPAYIVTTAPDVDPARRAAAARAVTDAHCAVTGAPAEFVHVIFLDGAAEAPGASLFGSVRAGRSEATQRELAAGLRSGIAGALGLADEAVEVATIEVPASWVMEGGVLLPEPGDEAEWLASRHAAPDPG